MDEHRQEVVVKDIEMGFGSMVVFMVKWAIAAIPALLILTVLVALGVTVSNAVFSRSDLASTSSEGPLATSVTDTPQEDPADSGPDPRLAQFEVVEANLTRRESGFMDETLIHLEVRNGTSEPIARAFFHGRYITEGRSVPWAEGEFNYTIPGGLEPGESASWELSPAMGSDFYGIEERPDAHLDVTVTALEGPDGERLFGS